MKVYSDLEVGSPFALGNLNVFLNESFVSGTLGPGCVSLRRFRRISQFLHVKVNLHPEIDSACMCDEWSYGGGGGRFYFFQGHFSNSVHLDVESPADCDFSSPR